MESMFRKIWMKHRSWISELWESERRFYDAERALQDLNQGIERCSFQDDLERAGRDMIDAR